MVAEEMAVYRLMWERRHELLAYQSSILIEELSEKGYPTTLQFLVDAEKGEFESDSVEKDFELSAKLGELSTFDEEKSRLLADTVIKGQEMLNNSVHSQSNIPLTWEENIVDVPIDPYRLAQLVLKSEYVLICYIRTSFHAFSVFYNLT